MTDSQKDATRAYYSCPTCGGSSSLRVRTPRHFADSMFCGVEGCEGTMFKLDEDLYEGPTNAVDEGI